MPLPTTSIEWPPPEIRDGLDRMKVWGAWWSADTDELSRAYGAGGIAATATRPGQYAGGVVGAVSRFWWGRPPSAGEPRAKLHVPLGSDLARAHADLLFSEPITAQSDDKATTDLLGTLLDDGAHARLLEGSEAGAALGGYYLVPAHDRELYPDGHAWLEPIPADQAIPTWRRGRLAALTLWRVVAKSPDGSMVWRHVERHEPGVTLHGLYQGDGERLGHPIPLTEHVATEHLAGYVRAEDGAGIETGVPGLAVSYIPHRRPNPLWRNDATLGPMGLPAIQGAEPFLDALDEVYSSWMRDIRLAKGRIIVPASYLQTGGRGQAPRFDPDREAFTLLPGAMDAGEEGAARSITVQQFAIRFAEHAATARDFRDQAVRRAGLNPGTIGDRDPGQGGAKTATEITADERRSMMSRNRGIAYHRPELAHSLRALAMVDAVVYQRPTPTGLDSVRVLFADSVSEDPLTLAQTAQALRAAEAASTEALVDLVNPDQDEPWKRAEVARILDERKAAQPAPPVDLLDPGLYDRPDDAPAPDDPAPEPEPEPEPVLAAA